MSENTTNSTTSESVEVVNQADAKRKHTPSLLQAISHLQTHRISNLRYNMMARAPEFEGIVVERGPTGSNREEPAISAEGGSLRTMARAG
jgi:hypothetical protein